MPQFDFFSFFVQIFWILTASCIAYLFYLKVPIRKLAEIFKMRAKLKDCTEKMPKKTNKNFIYNSVVKYFK